MTRRFALAAVLTLLFSLPAIALQDGGQWQGPQGDLRTLGTAGTITEIKGNTLVLKTYEGKTATVQLSSDTRFMKDRQPAKLTDFKVGDMVFVRGEAAGADNWKAIAVAAGGMMMRGPGQGMTPEMMAEKMGKEFIAGEVKAIDLDNLQLTILRPDGQTQVIEVDETTSFRKRGESITLADIKVGDRVTGPGALKNGVFIPSTLMVGGMMRRQAPPPDAAPPAPKSN